MLRHWIFTVTLRRKLDNPHFIGEKLKAQRFQIRTLSKFSNCKSQVGSYPLWRAEPPTQRLMCLKGAKAQPQRVHACCSFHLECSFLHIRKADNGTWSHIALFKRTFPTTWCKILTPCTPILLRTFTLAHFDIEFIIWRIMYVLLHCA